MALFNVAENGSMELSRLTGQWYASTPFSSIAAEVGFATREVAGRVGTAVIEAAEANYESNGSTEFVRCVQMPIACLAILRHAALSGVSHEGTGRKVKMDDNEKMPFEWMVDRDDRAMRERYHRALDALYAYLEDNAVASWTESDERAMIDGSVVTSIRQFEEIYPIEGSYYIYYLLQALIKEEQRTELEPLMGSRWAAALEGTEDEGIMTLVRRVAVLSALITAGERWSLEVFPLSVARRFAPSYQGNRASSAATTAEIEWYLAKLRKQKADALGRLAIALEPSAPAPALLPKNDRRKKYFTTV